jgi:U6 snRNA-associated Sm-like protein LSm1
LDAEDEVPLQQVPVQELEAAYKRETELRKKKEAEKARILFEGLGFSKEGGEGDWY